MELCFCIAANSPRSLAERAPDLSVYGVSCLEITWQGFPHWDAARCAEEREGLAAHGLRLRSVHMPFGPELNIIDRDPGLRLHALEAHLHMLPGCAALGVEILVMHPGREFVSRRTHEELVDSCVDAATEITARAADLGMRVALENVLPAHALGAHESIAEIVDRVDHPGLGVCLDTGHANVVDSVHRAIEVLAGRIIHVHVHDNHGQADEHLCPGGGDIDWPRVMSDLRGVGYESPLTLECKPPDVPKDRILAHVLEVLGETNPSEEH